MYDPSIGRWLEEDSIGMMDDTNLYRYVHNGPTNNTDPSGLQHLPSEARGTWIRGTRGHGVFEYSNTPQNQEAGVVGARITFRNDHIGIGGFPSAWYWGGDVAGASVQIPRVLGTEADFTAADAAMRERLRNPNWTRPAGYTWNHAGDSSSTTMELVDTALHRRVAHQGSAAAPRAGLSARVFGALTIYTTLRDACEATGMLPAQTYVRTRADYYFTAADGSVFIIQLPGWPSSIINNPWRLYVSGPRVGQTEEITSARVETYRREAEVIWGRHENPWFGTERFIPGTHRDVLYIYDDDWRRVGYIDQQGRHMYPRWEIGPPQA